MNGYRATQLWARMPTPKKPKRGDRESMKAYLSRVELLWLDEMMSALGLTLLNKYATLARLRILVEDESPLLSSTAELCPLFPSPDDDWVREIHLLGRGMYGKAYTVRLDGACWQSIDPRWADLDKNLTYEIPAVVKESIGSQALTRYQNTLHEILINQMLLRPALLHTSLPSHFPLMYAFIACEPSRDEEDAHFCAAHPTIVFEDLNMTERDDALSKGTLQLFPVFERVEGVTLDALMHQVTFDPDDIDLLSNLLEQLFGSLDVINQRIIYAHNDLHVENVMVMPTRARSFSYARSDGMTHQVEPRMRVVMIDQGLAGGSFEHRGHTYLAYYQLSSTVGHQGCVMVSDIFRVFRSLWTEWPRDSFGHQVVDRMITSLFGNEIVEYISSHVSSFDTWLEYVIWLNEQGQDQFARVTGLTHLHVLHALEAVMNEVEAERTDYTTERVQSIVRRRLRRHLANVSTFSTTPSSSSFPTPSSSSEKKKEEKLFAQSLELEHHPSERLARRLDRQLDRLHRRMRLRGNVCACLPQPMKKK